MCGSSSSAPAYMRDFLHSEIGDIHGISNLPDDPDLTIMAGKLLCEHLLEPLQATFGRIAVRSAYRSSAVNALGNARYKSCGSNERNAARHIWDRRDRHGFIGAMASIVVPWFADRYAAGASWQAMAWWIHDHLPYSELQFFPKLAALVDALGNPLEFLLTAGQAHDLRTMVTAALGRNPRRCGPNAALSVQPSGEAARHCPYPMGAVFSHNGPCADARARVLHRMTVELCEPRPAPRNPRIAQKSFAGPLRVDAARPLTCAGLLSSLILGHASAAGDLKRT
jgi:hypothetical protein